MERLKTHPVDVEGYEGLLEMLAERVHRLRYDRVELYYRRVAAELTIQAEADERRSRPQLAARLREAAELAEKQRVCFGEIFALCRPHMQHELGD